jgi:GDP-L-fucose synthase
MQEQAEVVIWGSGSPLREFLSSDDLADACVFLMELYSATDIGEFVNIGAGREITICELAELVAEVIGFKGELTFDTSKPDGTPRKLLDTTRLLTLGWQAKTDFRKGVNQAYEDFLRDTP